VEATDFAARMKSRRKELGITQTEIAKNLSVTPQHVSAIEQSTHLPSLNFVVELAEQLGITTDYLLTGKEQLTPDTIAVIRADHHLPFELKEALVTIIKTFREKN
jgi:transcriptional regulator with XRE-family HTH domain